MYHEVSLNALFLFTTINLSPVLEIELTPKAYPTPPPSINTSHSNLWQNLFFKNGALIYIWKKIFFFLLKKKYDLENFSGTVFTGLVSRHISNDSFSLALESFLSIAPWQVEWKNLKADSWQPIRFWVYILYIQSNNMFQYLFVLSYSLF